jgi:hypothetical protein
MPGGMPYQLEKGPYFAVAESMLGFGGNCDERLELLKLMLRGDDPNTFPTLNSRTLDAPGNPRVPDATERYVHMNIHWFGRQQPGGPGTQWIDQDAFDINDPKPTGYWRQWYGQAGKIVADTFIRAVEVSLGIDHVAPGKQPDIDSLVATRCWPIEVFWRCPAPWFEGWVTWRREPDDSGHVTVHLHSPSHCGSALLLSPVRQSPDNQVLDYKDEPVSSAADRGMWVIAHKEQVQHNLYAVTEPSPPGAFPLPQFGPFVESRGDIVCVQPNEPDGGVRGQGRNYVPGPVPTP